MATHRYYELRREMPIVELLAEVHERRLEHALIALGPSKLSVYLAVAYLSQEHNYPFPGSRPEDLVFEKIVELTSIDELECLGFLRELIHEGIVEEKRVG